MTARIVCALVLVGALAAAADARPIAYAIAIGNNAPPAVDPTLPALRYADDDAVRFYQLFARFSADARLLTVMDVETQHRYPGLAATSMAPTLANLSRVVAELATKMAADLRRGDQPVFYLTFSGHGSTDAAGTAFLSLLDAELTRTRLYDELLAHVPATYSHVIIDACNAGAVVGVRGGFEHEIDATPISITLSEQVAVAEDMQRRWPTVGVLIATTAGQEAHEWSHLESGVFTHEVISGLLGAADVNGDGKIEYSELAAFIAAANRDISDPRAAAHVIARAPRIDQNAPLIVLDGLRNTRFLTGSATTLGHFYIELANGQRYLEAHPAADQPIRLALPTDADAYVRTDAREATIRADAPAVVAIGKLAFTAHALRDRGSLASALQHGMFEHEFGAAYYRGYVDSSDSVGVSFEPPDAVARVDVPPPRRSRTASYALFGVAGAAVITVAAASIFAHQARSDYNATELQQPAADAASRYQRDTGIAIGAGIAAVGAGIAAYFLWPSGPTVGVGLGDRPAGHGLTVGGRF